jgi:hypothetical protein
MADEKKQSADDRIKELEAQLQAVEATHTAQATRGDELEKKLKAANARADKAEAQAKGPQGNHVILDGQCHKVIGVFRADNTFVEVKRGHCDEGVTLVAIDKVH